MKKEKNSSPLDRKTTKTYNMHINKGANKMKCLKLSEAAKVLNVSTDSVRRWARDGKIPAVKLEKVYRIIESDLEKFIEDRKVPQGSNR